jgi:predicted AAA+ superfamily ATPase
VKTPKLHFLDTGLACYLLGIRSARELEGHPLRGAIFESWVVSEVVKARLNLGLEPDVSFFRDAHGLEVDLVVSRGEDLIAVEAKSGSTVPVEAFAPLRAVAELVPEIRERVIVHGGVQSFTHDAARALGYRELDSVRWGGANRRKKARPGVRAPGAKRI